MATHSEPSGAVVIGGLGMVASLGLDAATVCAAARAGLMRSRTLENYRLRSAVEGDEEPVIGHPVAMLTRGFEGRARQMRLLQGALADLLMQTPQVDWQAEPHKFYIAFPDPARIGRGAELIADESARRSHSERLARSDESESPPETSPASAAESLMQRAAELARWPATPVIAFSRSAGKTAALEAIQAAIADLASGVTTLAVVIAADSLLDEETLNWLHMCGRLKCDAAPAGLRPGEAGVALMLCSRASAYASSGCAQIQAMAFAEDAHDFLSGRTPVGEGLAEVVGRLWAGSEHPIPWIVSDQNGEYYRAADWGFAAVRLRAQEAAFASPVLWYPAASVGDTGAASALVGICYAERAWRRGYAPGPLALIAASDDESGRGALALCNVGA
jgi:3-oxoacyl-[acyl-carrier-protein] synthase-1